MNMIHGNDEKMESPKVHRPNTQRLRERERERERAPIKKKTQPCSSSYNKKVLGKSTWTEQPD